MEEDVKELEQAAEKPEKKKKKHKALWIILIILGVLILGTLGTGFFMFRHYYSKMNYEEPTESVEIDSELLESLSVETIDESEVESVQETEEAPTSGGNVGGAKVVTPHSDSKVYNLMLIGVDRTDRSWNGNSDAMILMSINYTKGTVTLTSFMRDSAAQIPGVGYTKLNHSFAVGGGLLLLATIRENYGIPVDHYAWIDFEAMKEVIDVLGGVDMTLTPREAEYCFYGSIPATQVCHLNGEQALMHARDRSSGGNDYMRTQRQRDTLMAIVNRAKSGSLGDLTAAANKVLPYISHNIDGGTMASLMMQMVTVVGFSFSEQRIPYDGLFTSGPNYNLIPQYQATVDRWWAYVYGD